MRELNNCYNIDAMTLLGELPDKSVSLICTDPPYGVEYQGKKWDTEEYFLANLKPWLDECIRVGKTVVWFCAGSMLAHILRGREDTYKRILIWSKPFSKSIHNNIWYAMEPILIFGEQKGVDKNKHYGSPVFRHNNVHEFEHGHPTSKPLKLIEELLYFYSNEGDLVVDPFAGSGTTLEACIRLKRNYLGSELDQEYFNALQKRLMGGVIQGKLL